MLGGVGGIPLLSSRYLHQVESAPLRQPLSSEHPEPDRQRPLSRKLQLRTTEK